MEVVENEDRQRDRDTSLRKEAERNETTYWPIDVRAPYRESRSNENAGGADDGSNHRKRCHVEERAQVQLGADDSEEDRKRRQGRRRGSFGDLSSAHWTDVLQEEA